MPSIRPATHRFHALQRERVRLELCARAVDDRFLLVQRHRHLRIPPCSLLELEDAPPQRVGLCLCTPCCCRHLRAAIAFRFERLFLEPAGTPEQHPDGR